MAKVDLERVRRAAIPGSFISSYVSLRERRPIGVGMRVPDESTLYIVKGINHWRKQQRASMMARRGH
jgi:hypothetical protein